MIMSTQFIGGAALGIIMFVLYLTMFIWVLELQNDTFCIKNKRLTEFNKQNKSFLQGILALVVIGLSIVIFDIKSGLYVSIVFYFGIYLCLLFTKLDERNDERRKIKEEHYEKIDKIFEQLGLGESTEE